MLNVMADSVHNQIKRTSVELLIADLELGLTFLDVADTSINEQTIRRNSRNGRNVYDTALRLLPRLTLNKEERQTIEDKLATLKKRLAAVGEPI